MSWYALAEILLIVTLVVWFEPWWGPTGIGEQLETLICERLDELPRDLAAARRRYYKRRGITLDDDGRYFAKHGLDAGTPIRLMRRKR